MSKVEVDQITQQSGTTLTVGGGACKTAVVDATTVTLGRCGGTVSLASGATQTGFGRTGTVDWITTPKVTGDSPITAVSGNGYFLNTTAGTITINLPAGAAGSIVSLADYAATWQTNNVTVSPNGAEKMGGLNANVTLNTEGQSVTLVYVDAVQGWINTMDSTSNVRASAFMAASVSGACNTLATAPCCANTKIATFTGPGTFTVCNAAICAANNVVSYLVVAGGASAGNCLAGGGGAGGVREVKSPVTPYTASPLDGYATPANRVTVTAQGYGIVVGAGGASVNQPTHGIGVAGIASSFAGISAAGGGGGGTGGTGGTGPTGGTGISGGSGGGASGQQNCAVTSGAGNTPPVSPSQGNPGGPSVIQTPSSRSGSGGGGATEVGVNGTSPQIAGRGGAGATTNISASPLGYSGGGAGGVQSSGGTAAGSSPCGTGGASAAAAHGTAGTINRGGGGGSGGAIPSCYASGAGGSGIVIIRYKFQ